MEFKCHGAMTKPPMNEFKLPLVGLSFPMPEASRFLIAEICAANLAA
jgi:hypothetical protein